MMKNTILRMWVVMAVVAVLFTMGCQQPDGVEHPATYGVTGTITLDGVPLEGATVSFVPKGSGDPAVGKTDASGKYTLTSFGEAEGATPGQYSVLVSKHEFASASGGGAAGEEMPADYTPTEGAEQAGKSALPAKYQNPAESGLTATVTEDASKNVLDFALESGGAAPAPKPEK